MNTPKRYHPALVTLHWITVIAMLGAGFLAEDEGNSPINIHMIFGVALLVIMLFRVIVRFSTAQPAWADTGNQSLNKLGELVHLGLYLIIFFILGLGGLIAYNRNLFAVALGVGNVSGRAGLIAKIHHLGWLMALLLIAAHVGAALYHQFILKDHLLARMWFGKR